MSLALAHAARDAARLAQREERFADALQGWSITVGFFDAAVMEARIPSKTGCLLRQRDHAAVMLTLTRAVVELRGQLTSPPPWTSVKR